MIKVSIIIPIYNVEKYVEACLRSVALQSMTDGVEVVLVDDCGSDNSMAVVDTFLTGEYAQPNSLLSSNTTILHHAKNRGLSAARNTGIDAAKGKYLFFLDSDDELTSGCIEQLYNLAETYNADMVQGCYIADAPMLNNFWQQIPAFSDDKGYIKRTMLDFDHYPIMAQNRLVRRDLVLDNKLYFKEGIIHEDNHWTFFLAKHINRLAVCNAPTYLYRTTPGSITSAKNLEKEAHAFKTLIIDFTNNIDSFEAGAQKRLIFLNVRTMWLSGYYLTKEEARNLTAHFAKVNSVLERLLLWLCLNLKVWTLLNNKLVNLLQRVYLR